MNKAHLINNLFWLAVWVGTTTLVAFNFGSTSEISVWAAIALYTAMEIALWFVIHNAIDEYNKFFGD